MGYVPVPLHLFYGIHHLVLGHRDGDFVVHLGHIHLVVRRQLDRRWSSDEGAVED